MMREIKFRAWNKMENSMEAPYDGQELIDYIEGMIFRCGEKMLMQYIGLKDKNGKEIYHGDLLMFKNPDSESFYEGFAVVTETETLGYDFQPIPSLTIEDIFMHGYDSSMFWHDFDNDVEIIGNIYENPELLNGLR